MVSVILQIFHLERTSSNDRCVNLVERTTIINRIIIAMNFARHNNLSFLTDHYHSIKMQHFNHTLCGMAAQQINFST